ncbi:MAG: enoyl-CoA hydratase/isomerase family protein [Deltaproteobacteria bacterium]|nr:enoyl-CoA hydratase/isomerase family protein [Deltaproteobacteria bacterium]
MPQRHVRTERSGERLTVTLDRPELHNALNDAFIDELAETFGALGEDPSVRCVVLAGAGKSFCAGADLEWMRSLAEASVEQNRADAGRLVDLLEAIANAPVPVIARVHGSALGGGMGLVGACDLAVAAPEAQFGLTEVRLGLAPAMIFPYLARRVQPHELLRAALTGERFDAERAQRMGLVNAVSTDLDGAVDGWCAAITQGGPNALAAVKVLFGRVRELGTSEAASVTTELIARLRCGEEGQEGMRAFLERRKPRWVTEPAKGRSTDAGSA